MAQQTLRLLDSLKLSSVTPRLSAFVGEIALRALGAFVLPLVLYALGEGIYKISGRRGFPDPGSQNIWLIILAALGIYFLVSAVIVVLRVKSTKVTLDKGRLQVSAGIFGRGQGNKELYRVEDVGLYQTFLNRLTGDGTLTLLVASGHGGTEAVALKGLARIDQLRELFEQLRSLVLLLRTGAWGKGIIN
jgi:hypothetical protein